MNVGHVIEVDENGETVDQNFSEIEEILLSGGDIELILSGHRIILRADDAGVITGYILEG